MSTFIRALMNNHKQSFTFYKPISHIVVASMMRMRGLWYTKQSREKEGAELFCATTYTSIAAETTVVMQFVVSWQAY